MNMDKDRNLTPTQFIGPLNPRSLAPYSNKQQSATAIHSLPLPSFRQSDPSIHRLNIQIPIDLPLLSIPLLQPLIRLLEMLTLEPAPRGTERARMHTHQHTVPLLIHLGHSLSSRAAPREKHHSARSLFVNDLDDLLREFLPASVRVTVGFVGADGEAGV